MMRFLAFSLIILLAARVMAQDELPQQPSESFDVEPPLLIPQTPAGTTRDARSAAEAIAGKDSDPDRIEALLGAAKRNAVAGERFYKSGVLAKLEMENRWMRVVRLEADLAQARLARATENAAAQRNRFEAGEISSAELDAANSAVAVAANEAQSAAAKRDHAELEAAELNLRRQRKLLALGSARNSEVERAEAKLAALQQAKN